MSTYIIGDVQGCYRELQALLEKIDYNPDRDRLGFVGDLVNRGPDSLAVLEFISQLSNPLVVLGNHDLHLLELAYGVREPSDDSLLPILQSKRKIHFVEWLRHQPLLLKHEEHLLVHAGLLPQWDRDTASQLASEVETLLSSSQCQSLMQHMRGNQPDTWQACLTDWERARFIINAFTRIRFCNHEGQLDLDNKTAHTSKTSGFQPWFELITTPTPIIFGHWAALNGECNIKNIHAIDTGCVWGGKLTAIELQTKTRFETPSLSDS